MDVSICAVADKDIVTSFNKDYYLKATFENAALQTDNYIWLIFNTAEANTGLASVLSRDGSMVGSLNLVKGQLVWTMVHNGEVLVSKKLNRDTS